MSSDPIDEIDIQKVDFKNIKIGVPYSVFNITAALNDFIKKNQNTFGYRYFRKDELQFRSNQQLLCSLLENLINKEGPIHFEFAVKRLTLLGVLERILFAPMLLIKLFFS